MTLKYLYGIKLFPFSVTTKVLVSISMKMPVDPWRLLCQESVVFLLVDSKLCCHDNNVVSCSTMVCAVLLIAGFRLLITASDTWLQPFAALT